MEEIEFRVSGMACTGCENRVETVIERVDGVHRVTADHETGSVSVTASADIEAAVHEAVYEAGYDVEA